MQRKQWEGWVGVPVGVIIFHPGRKPSLFLVALLHKF